MGILVLSKITTGENSNLKVLERLLAAVQPIETQTTLTHTQSILREPHSPPPGCLDLIGPWTDSTAVIHGIRLA